MTKNMVKDPRHDGRHIDYPEGYAEGTVVLVCGGVDSLLNADAHPDAELLFVDLGHADSANEYAACRELFAGRRFSVANVSARLGDTSGGLFLPARNMLLACLAVHYGSDIVFGAMADDHSVDKTPSAFVKMSALLTEQSGRTVAIRTPLMGLCKHEAAKLYLHDHPESASRLLRTWSCYGAGPERCYDCKNCFRWVVAMRWAGLDVPDCTSGAWSWALGRMGILCDSERAAIMAARR